MYGYTAVLNEINGALIELIENPAEWKPLDYLLVSLVLLCTLVNRDQGPRSLVPILW